MRRRALGLLALAFVLATTTIAAPSIASATGGGGQGGQTGSHCGVYPIAVKASTIASATRSRFFDDITQGAPSGHEGWLTWTGDVNERALATSLTYPGNSHSYVDPDDAADHALTVGDWVNGKPGAVSSAGVRAGLDSLVGRTIVVPVWDSARGTGRNVAYRVAGFASVAITRYRLGNDNKIGAVYLGASTCATSPSGPVATSARASTSEDRPVTITLTGTGTSNLTFTVGSPASGTIQLTGAPSCSRAGSGASLKGGGDHGGVGRPDVTCTVRARYTPAPDSNGSDHATFTVSDGRSTSPPASIDISVAEINDPPIAGQDSARVPAGASLTLPTSGVVANDVPGPANESGQKLTVTAVQGGPATHGTVTLRGGTITYTPAPGFVGTATFTYTVVDNGTSCGAPAPMSAKGIVTVTVDSPANRPPVASAANVDAVEDTATSIVLAGSDPDGDPLTYTVTSPPAHGTITGSGPALVYTPAADYFGLDELTFTVSDGAASSPPASVVIDVSEVNDAPVLGADSIVGHVGQEATITVAAVLANDVPGPANEAGQVLAVTEVTAGAETHGTVALAGGVITFVPAPGFSGSATFTYSACDDGTTRGAADPRCTAMGTVTVDLAAANQPPVADPATITAVEDTPVPVTLHGSDPDGDPLTFVVSGPGNGTLTGTGPSVEYTPATNFFGTDTFTFAVFDGEATSPPALVTLTVSEVNDPPTVGADSVAAPGHQPTTITAAALLGNDRPGPSNEALQTIAITTAVAGPDSHGTVTLANGSIAYVPDVGYAGPATFMYTVCDNGTTNSQPDPRCTDGTVNLDVAAAANAVPAADAGAITGREDTATTVTLTGDDADGDPLTFAIIGQPAHGTLSGTAPDLSYVPSADFFGQDSVTFTTFDGQATSTPVQMTINVAEVNDPPIAGADALVATAGQPLSLPAATLLTNDVAGPENEAGQTLAVAVVSPAADTHGAVVLLDGTITYTPDPGFAGIATFTYSVCDNGTTDGGSDPRCTAGGRVTVDVAPVSRPPVADPQSVTVAEDNQLPVVLTGSDPDGDAVTFAVAAAPAHGSLSGTGANVIYTPATDYYGPDTFTFSANDGRSSSPPATVSIDVTEVNDAPVLGTDTYNLGGAGTVPPPPPPPTCGDPCGVIFGDPHLLSFDEAAYDAQAVGELIAAKSTSDDFEVQARFAPVPGSRVVSIDTAVAMRVAGHRVTLYRTADPHGIDARVDGTTITVPATPQALPGGGTIGTYGLDDTIIVVWPDGSKAIVRAVGVFPEYYRFTVELGLAPARLGNVVGLLGDADGSLTGELETRAGQTVTYPNTPFAELYGTYVNSWRISQTESLFDYGAGQTTATFTDLTFPDAPTALTAGQRAAGSTTCSLFGITDPALLEACIVDVGITGDPDFATTAALAQAAGLGISTNTGAAAIGTTTTVVTSTPGENAVRTFTAPAGSKAVLVVTGNTFLTDGADITIRNPTGGSVTGLFANQPSGFRDVFTFPTTSTYTISIDPRGTATGTITFQLLEVPDNTGTTTIGADTTVTTTAIGENAVRTFTGTAGQILTLFVTGNTFGADGADIAVRNPTGGSVAGLFVNQPTGFRDVFTLPSTGTYTIVVDPREQEIGTLTFRVANVPENTGTTAVGTPTTVATTTIGENAVRTFTGVAGQFLTLHVSGNTYNDEGADIAVRNPTGGSVAGLFVTQPTGFRDVFTLPSTGTYTILVDPRQDETGALTFVLSSVPDNTGTTTIGADTTVTTTAIGENAVRTFTGTAGQILTLFVTGNTFGADGADIAVRNPTGGSVAGLFVNQPTGFRDVFTLPSTGTYTIVVDPREQEIGTLTFRLANVPENTGTTAVGTPTTVATTTIGENAVRTFTGVAGQRLTLSVAGNTFSAEGADIAVRNPTGGSVAGLFVIQPTGFRDVFTLPSTGTYTIVVDPRGQRVGSLTFTINEAPAALVVGPQAVPDRVDRSTASGSAPTSPSSAEGPSSGPASDAGRVVALASTPSLTITRVELLANDVPGPANESAQHLTVTAVTPGPFTHGIVAVDAETITYTPDDDYVGIATVGYTACDDGTTNGQPEPRCSTGTISINVTANHPPTVVPLAVATVEDTPVGVTLAGSDPDGEPITFQIATGAHRGTISGSAPQIVYTPAPDANGSDTFTYTASDGHDLAIPATVQIQVAEVNDAPAPHPDTVTVRSGQPAVIPATTLTTNDDAGPFDERVQGLVVTAVTGGPDTHGTIALAGGVVTYTPEAGYSGTAVAAYTVCDDGTTAGAPDPKCADGTLTFVLNRAPVAFDQTAQTSLTRPLTLTLTATDPDGDAITYAVGTQPAHGTLTGTAPTLTYRAATSYVGPDSFTFTVADAFGRSAAATVSIHVADIPAPVLLADSAAVRVGSTIAVAVLANDTAASGTLDPATLAITAPAARGTATVVGGAIRYTAGTAAGTDTVGYTVCDTGGGCASSTLTVTIGANSTPTANADSYDVAVGATLHPAAPGVLTNDTDPDTGDRLQARLVSGVGNGRLLLYSTGAFTYTPNGPGVDSFTYTVVDSAGAVSNSVTVTIYASAPAGPPVVGNDLFEVQRGRELTIAAPGVLTNDYSPNPRLGLTVELRRDAAKGTLLLQPDGSFVYTPSAGVTGIDQFSYTVRDAEGRVSAEAHVGLTITAGGPATATVGQTSPDDGAVITSPTPFTATLDPPAGETVSRWTVSYRKPGDEVLVPLAEGAGGTVATTFDPTRLRNGTYQIVIRAETTGGGILVDETGVAVEGDYKPGRYSTTYRDVGLNSADIPIELNRTYDSIDRAAGELGVGWSLELANFRIQSNGPLGASSWSSYTCGSFPFLATCYRTSKPHFVTVTWPDGHVERFRFAPNPGSQLVPTITTASFVAEAGSTSTLTPVGSGLLLSGSDFLLGDFFSADGIYDPIQFVLTDRFGVQYRLDKRTGLLGITDRDGNTVTIGSGGVDSSTGLSMTFQRDAAGRITGIASPGGTIVYSYDAAGDLVRVAYPNGTSQAFTYDGEHNLLTESGGGVLLRTVRYDPAGRVSSITDGEGHTATIDSDVDGHQQITTDRTGRLVTVSTYDDRGDLIRQDHTHDGTTITSSATYDAFGRQLTVTDPLGHTTAKTYDAAGNMLTATDGNQHTTTYTYNTFGQVLTITDPTGRVTAMTYDGAGNMLTETTAAGTTTHVYDADGLLVSKTDAANRTTTYTNDDAGFPASATDPAGNTVRQIHDPDSGWLTSVTDGNGSTTLLGYDAIGNLTSVRDGNSHTQTMAYDDLGQLTSITDAEGKTLRRTYDATGNLDVLTDRNGAVIDYHYDEEGRLVAKDVPDEGTTTYEYDPLGRLTDAQNATATLSFTYDDAGNVLTATTSGPTPPVTITYTYDAANRVTAMTGPGGTTAYGHDDADRLTSVTDPAGGIFAYGYDNRGLLTGLDRPNGVDDTLTYDAVAQLTSIASRRGAAAVGGSSYGYDPAGHRTSLANGAGTATFGYDRASQLVSATYPAATGLAAQTFGYDRAGNRTSTNGAPAASFAHDDANRLLEDPASDYTYDAEGNTLTRTVRATNATTTYDWNAEHQLKRITSPDGTTTSMRYDPFGRRIEIDDAGTVTRYVFDDWNVTATYDAGGLAATFVSDGSSNTSHLEMNSGGQRYFYLTDALGSTTALTALDGTVATTYAYDAFGTATVTGIIANPFTFAGQIAHPRSGLVLFPERVYAPASGRFLTPDPVFTANAYPYVKNDPLDKLDPTGGTIGGAFRGLVACAALVVGAANGNPGGAKAAQEVAKCAKSIVDAVDKRKKLQEAQLIKRAVDAQLAQRK